MSTFSSSRVLLGLLVVGLLAQAGLCQPFRIFQGSDYWFNPTKSTFDAAETDCSENFNGHLVSLLTPDEAAWLNTVYLENIVAANKGTPIKDDPPPAAPTPLASPTPSPRGVVTPPVVIDGPNSTASPPVEITPSPADAIAPTPSPADAVAPTPSPDAALPSSPVVVVETPEIIASPPVDTTAPVTDPAAPPTDPTSGSGTGTGTGGTTATDGTTGTTTGVGTGTETTGAGTGVDGTATGRRRTRRALLVDESDAPPAAWIGYKASSAAWTDGKPKGFSKFATPPAGGCGALHGETGQWVQVPCTTSLPYICKRTAGIYSPMFALAGAPGTPGAPGATVAAPPAESKKKGINMVALIAGIIPSSIAAIVAISYTAWKWNQRCKNKHAPDTVLESAPIVTAPTVSFMKSTQHMDTTSEVNNPQPPPHKGPGMSDRYPKKPGMYERYPQGPGRV